MEAGRKTPVAASAHLEKSPPPESPLQVSLVPSPAHSLLAPMVTLDTCLYASAQAAWVTTCTEAWRSLEGRW